jgi:ribosomal protein S18 acetylase RimI-like enzyme
LFLIRRYREDDAPAVRSYVVELQESERRVDARLRPGESMASEYLSHMLGRCAECVGTILVAEVNGVVTGFVTVLARVPFESLDDPPGTYAFVSDLVVGERFRRRGLGAQLLREAEQYAVAAGAHELRVGVLHENEAAARLYRRAGFAPYLQTLSKRFEPAAT